MFYVNKSCQYTEHANTEQRKVEAPALESQKHLQIQ